MAKVKLRIDSVDGGIIPTQYGPAPKDGYDFALGIDPDAVSNASGNPKSSGSITPVIYQQFSSSNLTSAPYWILNDPKTERTYAYCGDGKVLRYSYQLTAASETLLATLFNGNGNGAAYYDNYLYFTISNDVVRYGPLNGVPAFDTTYWTVTLGKAALGNPLLSFGNFIPPNHPMFLNSDNALYFGDFTNGVGKIHKIKTTKTLVEGDTDDGSAENVLDLPSGFCPTAISNLGTDLVVSAVTADVTQATSQYIKQSKSKLFFWDCVSDSFYRSIDVNDPYITALHNANGRLYVFSGPWNSGNRVSTYDGGDTLTEQAFIESGRNVLAGAVDSIGSRVFFGSNTTFPNISAVVYSIGSKNPQVKDVLHCPIRCSGGSTLPNVTAVKAVEQPSGAIQRCVVGWSDSSSNGLEKYSSSGTYFNQFRKTFHVGAEFRIMEIRMSFDTKVALGHAIAPTIYIDNASTSVGLTVVNSTTAGNKTTYVWRPPNLKARGFQNFALNLDWSGATLPLGVVFPIEITIDVNRSNRAG